MKKEKSTNSIRGSKHIKSSSKNKKSQQKIEINLTILKFGNAIKYLQTTST